MSVVIVGGHDRMHCRYKEICKKFGCKCKVFTQCPANFKMCIRDRIISLQHIKVKQNNNYRRRRCFLYCAGVRFVMLLKVLQKYDLS